ncbi:MAG: penicillin-binding transpeptidase domain-containing protein [Micrococcales bacterium]|nr:penicillin-binding transpeptidase domain-containing protein [Micrococcales bacterium]MCL2668856.1 penicillin-binding transpeptidase domain-containing protein [Micrococcales bacterium]
MTKPALWPLVVALAGSLLVVSCTPGGTQDASTSAPVIVAGGSVVVESVPLPDSAGYQRVYSGGDPAGAVLYSSVTGFLGLREGSGLEIHFYKQDGVGFVETTIIPSAQEAAMAALRCDGATPECLPGGDGEHYLEGAIVAIEPSTGRILALVSTPGFDPNPLASHDVDAAVAAHTTLTGAPGNPLRNKAYAERYYPGSTFTVITAAAALESGEYSPETLLYGPQVLDLPQTVATMKNPSGAACDPTSDQISLADSLKISCTTAFAQLGMDLGEDAVRHQAEAFGFDQQVHIPMPALDSTFPPVPRAAAMAHFATGQGVQATPLQMAMVSAAIANDGVMMRPYLAETVRGPDQSVITTTRSDRFGQPVSEGTARQLTQMMEATASSGGTAQADAVPLAAITGIVTYGNRSPYMWFTGFAPANNPQVAVVVFVKNGDDLEDPTSENLEPMARLVIDAVLNR